MRRRSRSPYGRDSGSGKRFAAVLGAILVAGALGTAFYYAQAKKSEQAGIDPETFCPKAGPVQELAVLVDRTDGLTEVQAEALSRRLIAWGGAVPAGGVFRVYEVGKGGRLLEPILSVCNPGDGKGASSWTSNPEMLQKRYEEKFAGPIQVMTDGMRGDAEADASPIFEAVQAISVKDFGPDSANLQKKELFLVTDLLQHGPAFSLYKAVPDFETFRKSPYAGSVRGDLKKVHVEIHLLNRLKAASKQTDALAEFWVRWLEDQGAIVEALTRVPG